MSFITQIDKNANGNHSTWASEVYGGPNDGLAAVYSKVNGDIYVLRGSLREVEDAKALAWKVMQAGKINLRRWKLVYQVPAKVEQDPEMKNNPF